MRLEIDVGEAGGAPRGRELAALLNPARRRRIDRFDLGVLAVFGLLSVWVLGLDLWQVVVNGRTWTGTDGVYIVDQMQYLAWIRDASHHLLVSNLFVLRPTATDYLQPAVTLSGAVTALGVPAWLSLLLWKPVAVVTAFFAVRAYCRTSFVGARSRRAALVLGLFFGSFSVVYGSFSVVGDLFLGFLSWGYTFGLLAVGCLVFALLGYARGHGTGRVRWQPAALGAIASFLHPWQGELLILIVIASELLLWRNTGRRPRQLGLPLLTLAATGAPLLYYLLLGKTDLSWKLAREASKHGFSLWAILIGIAPLAIVAALGHRGRSTTFLTAATRIWPFAALTVWVLSASQVSATPLHAFDGITIPLAVLAVKGVRAYPIPRARRLGVVAVALATVPATVYLMKTAANLAAPRGGNANFIAGDEHQALRYLARNRTPGGVLTQPYLGATVPGKTGRRTYTGDCLWSQPGCYTRTSQTQALFWGSLGADSARSFVRSTGARFVLADCTTTADLHTELAPITASVTRFGCAAVYEVGAPGPVSEPLAQSSAHAALRASGRQQRRVQSG